MNLGPPHLSHSGIDQSAAIDTVAKQLKRPARDTDENGYHREIIGAALEGTRAAWVEGRSKQVTPDLMDVHYHLRARDGTTELLNWEVASYNPYFGCEVGYTGWWGNQVILVYREKHATLVAAVPLQGSAGLFPIHDEWAVVHDVIYHASDEPGLVESVLIPELTTGIPIGVDEFKGGLQLRGALPRDAALFQQQLKEALFPKTTLDLEADLIVGALGYRFWYRWPEAIFTYTTGRQPWNSPCWLPLYWYNISEPLGKKRFLGLLEEAASRSFSKGTTPLSLALVYVIRRCAVLADACRKESPPEYPRCYFWTGWSQKAFIKDLDLFPKGFQEAFSKLRTFSSLWSSP